MWIFLAEILEAKKEVRRYKNQEILIKYNKMRQIKSVTAVLFSRLIGFILFLIIIALLNFLVLYIDNITFTAVVHFLNQNIWIMILFSLLIAGGELFSVLTLPFNLPYPLFNAIGSLFLVKFLFNILSFVNNELINVSVPNIGITFKSLFIIIAAIVFLIVLISGYVKILVQMYSNDDSDEDYVQKRVVKRVRRIRIN